MFKYYYQLIVFLSVFCNNNNCDQPPSHQLLCKNAECSEPIGVVEATQTYAPDAAYKLRFNIGEKFDIFGLTENKEFFFALKGKDRGLVKTKLVREIRRFSKDDLILTSLDDSWKPIQETVSVFHKSDVVNSEKSIQDFSVEDSTSQNTLDLSSTVEPDTVEITSETPPIEELSTKTKVSILGTTFYTDNDENYLPSTSEESDQLKTPVTATPVLPEESSISQFEPHHFFGINPNINITDDANESSLDITDNITVINRPEEPVNIENNTQEEPSKVESESIEINSASKESTKTRAEILGTTFFADENENYLPSTNLPIESKVENQMKPSVLVTPVTAVVEPSLESNFIQSDKNHSIETIVNVTADSLIDSSFVDVQETLTTPATASVVTVTPVVASKISTFEASSFEVTVSPISVSEISDSTIPISENITTEIPISISENSPTEIPAAEVSEPEVIISPVSEVTTPENLQVEIQSPEVTISPVSLGSPSTISISQVSPLEISAIPSSETSIPEIHNHEVSESEVTISPISIASPPENSPTENPAAEVSEPEVTISPIPKVTAPENLQPEIQSPEVTISPESMALAPESSQAEIVTVPPVPVHEEVKTPPDSQDRIQSESKQLFEMFSNDTSDAAIDSTAINDEYLASESESYSFLSGFSKEFYKTNILVLVSLVWIIMYYTSQLFSSKESSLASRLVDKEAKLFKVIAERDNLLADLVAEKENYKRHHKENSDLKDKFHNMSITLEHVKRENLDLIKKIELLRDENLKQKHQIQEIASRNDSLLNESEKISDETISLKNEFENLKIQAKESQKQIEELESILKKKSDEVEKLQNNNESLVKELEEVKEREAKLLETKAQLEESLELIVAFKVSLEKKDQEIKSLKRLVENNLQSDQFGGSLDELMDCVQIKAELDVIRNQFDSLSNERDKLETTKKELESKMNEISSQLSAAIKAKDEAVQNYHVLETYTRKTQTDLQMELGALKLKHDEIFKKNESVADYIANLESSNKNYKVQIDDLKHQYEQDKHKRSQEYHSLESKFHMLYMEKIDIANKFEAVKKENDLLRQRLTLKSQGKSDASLSQEGSFSTDSAPPPPPGYLDGTLESTEWSLSNDAPPPPPPPLPPPPPIPMANWMNTSDLSVSGYGSLPPLPSSNYYPPPAFMPRDSYSPTSHHSHDQRSERSVLSHSSMNNSRHYHQNYVQPPGSVGPFSNPLPSHWYTPQHQQQQQQQQQQPQSLQGNLSQNENNRSYYSSGQ